MPARCRAKSFSWSSVAPWVFLLGDEAGTLPFGRALRTKFANKDETFLLLLSIFSVFKSFLASKDGTDEANTTKKMIAKAPKRSMNIWCIWMYCKQGETKRENILAFEGGNKLWRQRLMECFSEDGLGLLFIGKSDWDVRKSSPTTSYRYSHRVTAIEKGLACVESKQEKLGTVSQDRKLNVVLIICWCVFSYGI